MNENYHHKLNILSQSSNNSDINLITKNEDAKKFFPKFDDIDKLFKNVGIT